MRCTNCGNELPDGAMFCDNCGAKVNYDGNSTNMTDKNEDLFCAVCGARIEPDTVFCGNCGAAVGSSRKPIESFKRCGHCGAKMSADEMFCGNCGASVNDAVIGSDNAGLASGKRRKSPLKGIVIAAAAVILAVGGCAAGYFAFVNDSSPIDDETNEVSQMTVAPTTETAAATPVSTIQASDFPTPAAVNPAQPPNNAPVPPGGQPGGQPVPPSEDYLFNSDTEYITEQYLNTQSQEQVRLILNEMYARHGYIFTLEQYKTYFSSKPWYAPKYTSAEETEKYFNSVEMQNKATIVAYEKAKGWR